MTNCSGGWRGRGRKPHMKDRALALNAGAFDPDAPAHRLGADAADVQPQAIADDVRGQITRQTHKALEEQWNLLGPNPQAPIAHRDFYQLAARAWRGASAPGRRGGRLDNHPRPHLNGRARSR